MSFQASCRLLQTVLSAPRRRLWTLSKVTTARDLYDFCGPRFLKTSPHSVRAVSEFCGERRCLASPPSVRPDGSCLLCRWLRLRLLREEERAPRDIFVSGVSFLYEF